MVGLVTVLWVGLLAVMWATAHDQPLLLPTVIFGTFAAVAGALLTDACRAQIRCEGGVLTQVSPWRKPRSLPLADLSTIDYSDFHRCFLLRSAAGLTIRIPSFMPGAAQFVQRLQRRLQAIPPGR
jgi:hypothetical protein